MHHVGAERMAIEQCGEAAARAAEREDPLRRELRDRCPDEVPQSSEAFSDAADAAQEEAVFRVPKHEPAAVLEPRDLEEVDVRDTQLAVESGEADQQGPGVRALDQPCAHVLTSFRRHCPAESRDGLSAPTNHVQQRADSVELKRFGLRLEIQGGTVTSNGAFDITPGVGVRGRLAQFRGGSVGHDGKKPVEAPLRRAFLRNVDVTAA
jgi:hypothetical protein